MIKCKVRFLIKAMPRGNFFNDGMREEEWLKKNEKVHKCSQELPFDYSVAPKME